MFESKNVNKCKYFERKKTAHEFFEKQTLNINMQMFPTEMNSLFTRPLGVQKLIRNDINWMITEAKVHWPVCKWSNNCFTQKDYNSCNF